MKKKITNLFKAKKTFWNDLDIFLKPTSLSEAEINEVKKFNGNIIEIIRKKQENLNPYKQNVDDYEQMMKKLPTIDKSFYFEEVEVSKKVEKIRKILFLLGVLIYMACLYGLFCLGRYTLYLLEMYK
jgi:tetrahydromethanopterin S-methyltransferase subunit G